MKLLNYHNFNFSFDFFQRNELHPIYKSINNPKSKILFNNKDFKGVGSIKKNIYEIKFIPTFLTLKFPDLPNLYKVIKFNRIENFFINLEGFASAEDYLKSIMGPKSRSQLRRRIHRLENCFDVEYQFYFGDNISQQKYDELFDNLEQFIERRFKQRGDHHSQKNNLSNIRQNGYQLILEKKASLFVIKADNKIIDVCLNYHFQNIVQHFIRSYDIDYSKFWIGQVDIYKQIELCFQHNFTIFDFMWDELIYKKRWSNSNTIYKHHFIYKNTNPIKKPLILLMIRLYKWHDVLKTKPFYKSIKKRIERLKNKKPKTTYSYFSQSLDNMPLIDTLKKISIENIEYSFLRKFVYDFQYLNFETSMNIETYEMISEKNSYIIKGKVKIQVKVTRHG